MAYNAQSNKKKYTYVGPDGSIYTLDFSDDGNTYLIDNAGYKGKKYYVDGYIQYIQEYGTPPTHSQLEEYIGTTFGDKAWNNIITDYRSFLLQNNIAEDRLYLNQKNVNTDSENPATSTTPEIDDEDLDPRVVAEDSYYNKYYKDLFSLSPGTTGATMMNRYALAEQNAALSNMQLAEAQYQQAAMQQAETVKAITDSVKAERMARLRAGMSESQIANQDMQVMLNNMNQLNQQVGIMNQNQLAAQQQYNLAQDTAYQQYIQSATGLGSVSAAMAASDAGDAYQQALRYMQQTGTKNFQKAYEYVTKGGTS